MFDEVEKAAQYPTIGLLIGESFNFDYLPHLNTFLMSASTIRAAFEVVQPIQELISPYLAPIAEENKGETIIKIKPHGALTEEDDRRIAEIIFSFHKTIGSRLIRRAIHPTAVYFRHSRSELVPLYAEFFHATIVLNAPENATIYAPNSLDFSLPGGLPEIRKQAQNLVFQKQANSSLHGGLFQDIKNFLTQSNRTLNASIEQVAQALNMSVRTLQRRLTENKQGLSEIRDQVRFQLAVDYLKFKRYSIKEISANLGFLDPHCFTVAFKRWSGVTPSVFRKKSTRSS
jgi:AraC-like DNA-binding protein